MRIVCEYCDSILEIEGTSTCPNCGASLAGVLQAAEEKAKAEREAEEAKREEQRKQLAAERQQEELLNAIKGVALSAAGSILGGTLTRGISGLIRQSISEGIRNDLASSRPPHHRSESRSGAPGMPLPGTGGQVGLFGHKPGKGRRGR
ncbi:MAG: hypothetical protein II719_00930 [Clostridia bacterium]|nr:hypothetical protein [Clostridia bacterium]